MSSFESLRSQRIESLNIEAQEYRHGITGAQHLHLSANDNNNAFIVGFRTLPCDSTGVAHILEHTALCGSRRFPVRDPFFMMTRRSLNTFMNAFTSSDWTAYPFATQNKKDFDNLLQVYLDAVFFPNLDELDFAQEGHRLEFEVADDPASDLVYKGVVYNEMKGALSAPTTRLWYALSAALFPTTTYHHNSGGDPEAIPELTWPQLRDFHARFYHPSNAYFCTYGDFDVREHQAHFHEWALKHFTARAVANGIHDEQRYGAPRALTIPYPVNGEEPTRGKTHIVLGWLLNNTTDLQKTMETQLLAGVLLDNSASPLRHALERCPLATAPSELCGLDAANREATFVCGVEGSDPEHAEAVEETVMKVIQEVAEKGVERDLAASVLHQMELSQREIRGGRYPYGLQLLAASLGVALHGGDAIAALAIDPILEHLRVAIERSGFIPGLAREWLRDNPHRVRVAMIPDAGFNARHAAQLKSRLAATKQSLSIAEKTRIIAHTAALKDRQQQAPDAALLPKVGVEDIPADFKVPASERTLLGSVPVIWFRQGTNGLVYEEITVELPALEPGELGLLSLYCNCVTELGYGDKGYVAAQTHQAAISGGIAAHCPLRAEIQNVQRILAYFQLSSNCLYRNHGALAQLLHDAFYRARFDELERLRELIAQIRAARESAVTDQGHVLAMTAACAGFGPAAALSHRWDGLAGLRDLKALERAIENQNKLEEFAAGLKRIHERLTLAAPQLLVVGEDQHLADVGANLASQWAAFQPRVHDAKPFSLSIEPSRVHEAWITNTEVNFCARAYPTVPSDHGDAAALIVLGRFLHNGYLHRAIREQGGAYGSGAAYDGDTGAFKFFSYRDPRVMETLEAFDAALEWLHGDGHGYEKLEEAILGVIAALDRPSSPAGEAIRTFAAGLFGRSPEYRRRLRQRVLQVTVADLQRVAQTYLVKARASTAIVTNSASLGSCAGLNLEPHGL